jgi:hypothetical protein
VKRVGCASIRGFDVEGANEVSRDGKEEMCGSEGEW